MAGNTRLTPGATARILPWLEEKPSRSLYRQLIGVDGTLQPPGSFDAAIETPRVLKDDKTMDATDTEEVIETVEVVKASEAAQMQESVQTQVMTENGETVEIETITETFAVTDTDPNPVLHRSETDTAAKRPRLERFSRVATQKIPPVLKEETAATAHNETVEMTKQTTTAANTAVMPTSNINEQSGRAPELRSGKTTQVTETTMTATAAPSSQPVTESYRRRSTFVPVSQSVETTQATDTTTATLTVDDKLSKQTYVPEQKDRRRSSLAPVPAHLEEPSQVIEKPLTSALRIEDATGTATTSKVAQPTYSVIKEVLRKGSLAPLPPHVEEPSPSPLEVTHRIHASPPQVIVNAANLSPTQPVPKRNILERIKDNRRLSNAIENMEELVQEAVVVSEKEQDSGHIREIHDMIQGASTAAHEAYALHHVSPLPVDSESSHSWCSSSESEDYGNARWSHHHAHRLPHAHADETRVTDETTTTTTTTVVEQESPRAQDWAYGDRQVRAANQSSSAESHVRFEEHDTLLPPKPAQSSTREHTEFVLRPTRAEDDHLRSHSHRRRGHASGHHGGYHHHHHHGHLRHHRNGRSSSRHHGHRHHEEHHRVDSPFENDEELQYHLNKLKSQSKREFGYGLTIHEQDSDLDEHQHHHTFSLRRHHRRQPIARNWSNLRKRFTATIACINTALIGMIIGIYVRLMPRVARYQFADDNRQEKCPESNTTLVMNAIMSS